MACFAPGTVVVFERVPACQGRPPERVIAIVTGGPWQDGTYDLDCQRQARPEALWRLNVGDPVEYLSSSANKWIRGTVVRPGRIPGTLDLDVKECAGADRLRPVPLMAAVPPNLPAPANTLLNDFHIGVDGVVPEVSLPPPPPPLPVKARSPCRTGPLPGGGWGPLGLRSGEHCFYRSTGHGWIPAKVLGWRPEEQTYDLDVKQLVPPEQLRPIREGDILEYQSSTTQSWIPATVIRIGRDPGTFDLDVKSSASIKRLRPTEAPPASPPPLSGGFLPETPACGSRAPSTGRNGERSAQSRSNGGGGACTPQQSFHCGSFLPPPPPVHTGWPGASPTSAAGSANGREGGPGPGGPLSGLGCMMPQSLPPALPTNMSRALCGAGSFWGGPPSAPTPNSAGSSTPRDARSPTPLGSGDLAGACFPQQPRLQRRASTGGSQHEGLQKPQSFCEGAVEKELSFRIKDQSSADIEAADSVATEKMEQLREAVRAQDAQLLRLRLESQSAVLIQGEELDQASHALWKMEARPAALTELRAASSGTNPSVLEAAIEAAAAVGAHPRDLEAASLALKGLRSSAWVYAPADGKHMDIRAEPCITGTRTKHVLHPGDLFRTSVEAKGDDGVLYLKLADNRGWVFQRKPGVGTLCYRHQDEAPGMYIVTHDGAAVTRTVSIKRDEDVIDRVEFGEVVNVIETAYSEERIRGRLQKPAGWISLLNMETGKRWAHKRGA